jgi:hypothetical protein
VPSWVRHLRAERKATKTIEAYESSAHLLVAFLRDRGMPLATRAQAEARRLDELF